MRSPCHILPLFLLCPIIATAAQRDSIQMSGKVYDVFLHKQVPAFVELLSTDSVMLKSDSVSNWEGYRYSQYWFNLPREERSYILRVSAKGYYTATKRVTLKKVSRKYSVEAPDITLKKRQDDVYDDIDLEGVVVKGTRVRVAWHGDTLVYDAAAFHLPEGSMLDALVKQLPGAEMKSNGDIYINGRKIDFLTLNGKDFFRGKNKIMLDNLPYFTVSKLKVYEKDTDNSRLAGRTIERKDYVMDVELKREYARGSITNVTGGVGTHSRWMAKLFGMYYTEGTQMGLFSNMNNVNEDEEPGYEGDWMPERIERGRQTTRMVGLNVNTGNKTQSVNDRLSTTVQWDKEVNDTKSFSETYNDASTIYSGGESTNRSSPFAVNIDNELEIKALKTRNHTSLSASRNKSRGSSIDSTYTSALANSTEAQSYVHRNSLNISSETSSWITMPSGDLLNISLYISASRSNPAESFYNTRTYYAATDTTDVRQRYSDTHRREYQLKPSVKYSLRLPRRWRVTATAQYDQSYNSEYGLQYRLESLSDAPFDQPGWLPDNADTVLGALLDTDNSTYSSTLARHYNGGVTLSKSYGNTSIVGGLSFEHVNERMRYEQSELDTVARRSYNTLQPSLIVSYNGDRTQWQMAYRGIGDVVSFETLMPVANTSNPLVTRISNPSLRNGYRHSLDSRLNVRGKAAANSGNIGLVMAVQRHAVGMRTAYDSTTGAYTYMQDNVDGNWNATLDWGLRHGLDKKRRWDMDLSGDFSYNHSVNFASLSYCSEDGETGSLADAQLSKVNNFSVTARARVTYRKDYLSLSAFASATSRFVRSRQDYVNDLDLTDVRYGFSVSYTVPWLKVNVATDMQMYSRRGYESDEFNTDELVWNASLSRSFFKGRLTLTLAGNDLLRQLSASRCTVNAQGRTERWYNTIPSYSILTVAYKFVRRPKNSAM